MTKILTVWLVLAALLTVSPLPSQAACTWVRWTRFSLIKLHPKVEEAKGKWEVEEAFQTIETCVEEIKLSMMLQRTGIGPREKIAMDSFSQTKGVVRVKYHNPTGKVTLVMNWESLCLPDTVSPIAPSTPR